MEGLRWVFELRDRLSGPASRGARQMKRLHQEVGRAERELQGLRKVTRARFDFFRDSAGGFRATRRGFGAISDNIRDSTTGLSSMAFGVNQVLGAAGQVYGVFLRIASVVGGLVTSVGGLVRSFGEGVLEAGGRQLRSLTGLRALLGDGAEQALADARDLSEFLGTDLGQTLSSLQQLMAQGFGAREAQVLFQTLADLQAVNPAANIDSLNLAISQIRSKGRLQGEELMQLTEAGLNRGEVLAQIGQVRGLTGSRQDVVRQVEDLMRRGQVGSDEALQAIVASVQSMTGMDVGGLAREQSMGLPGLLMRLQQAPTRIFDAIATEARTGGAFEGLSNTLREILGLLDPSSQGFRDFVSIASEAFGVLVEGFRTAWELGMAFFSGVFGEASESADPIEDVRAGIRGIRDWLVSLRESGTLDTVREFGAGFVAFARAIWPAVQALAVVAGAIGALLAIFATFTTALAVAIPAAITVAVGFLANLAVQAFEWGRRIGEGLVLGIQSMVATLAETASSLGRTVAGGVISALRIGSPSRVMEELGVMTALGFERGLQAMPAVTVPAPEITGGGAGPSASGGAVELNLSVEVHADGTGPQATAEAVREVVLESVREVFGRAGGIRRGALV